MSRTAAIAGIALPLLLALATLDFAHHAVTRGVSLTDVLETATSRLYIPRATGSNLAIYGHVALGGLITVLAPLQLIPQIRRRTPRLHHAIGYMVGTLALLTALGGLVYILRNGTIGGPLMNLGFAVYGLLMIWAAQKTLRYARARDPRHRDWALRLIVLVLGSWLYRVHYALWYVTTGGLASTPQFTGLFDQVQNFAFYLLYLLILELWLRRRPDQPRAALT